MTLNKRRVLTGLAVTGVLGGALAGGGVALASTGSATSSAVSTVAAATPTPTPSASRPCDGRAGLGGQGMMWDGQSVTKAVANYLGISQDQLRTQLEAGKSLAQVATADGKSVSGLKNALVTAITARVNAASGLTAAQKTKLISELKSHVDGLVNSTIPAGFGMRPMMGSTAMMGGRPAM